MKAPAGATVIDGSGQYVMPGIIDCHSHIATAGGVNEGSLAVTAMVGVEDVIDSTDINIYRNLAGGVTSSNILHGSANPIGGRNQLIKLRWGKEAKGLIFEGTRPGIKFALGENPKRSRREAPGRARRGAGAAGALRVLAQSELYSRSRGFKNEPFCVFPPAQLDQLVAAARSGPRSREEYWRR